MVQNGREKGYLYIYMSSGDESDFYISVDVIRLTKSNSRLNCECKMINVKKRWKYIIMPIKCAVMNFVEKSWSGNRFFFLDISTPEDTVFHGLCSGLIRFLGHVHISIRHIMKRYHSDHKMYVVMNFVEKSWSGNRCFSWIFVRQKTQFFTGYVLA